jgi:hypothetical protein
MKRCTRNVLIEIKEKKEQNKERRKNAILV